MIHETAVRSSSYGTRDLTCVFPGVLAVDRVSLEVRPGEIHGVIGKNGAGKSVLMSMLAGVIRPTSGDIWIGEDRVDVGAYQPARAHELGVSLITQEPLFAPYLNVMDNVFMGRTPTGRFGIADHAEMRRQVVEVADRLSIHVSPRQRMLDLAIEDQQMIALGKALFLEKARVILLDEITASLSRARKQSLLSILKTAVAETPTVSFTLITHHINEIIDFCDRVTVMRDGCAVRTLDVGDTSKEELAAWIVGDEETFKSRAPQAPGPSAPAERKVSEATAEPVLSVDGLTSAAFEDVSFDLQPGEILGVAGLDGSGKDEVLMALVGLMPTSAGVVRMGSSPVVLKSPQHAGRLGIAYLPKKREEFAVLQNMSVQDNTLLPIYPKLRTRLGLIDETRARSVAEDGVRSLQVKTPSLGTVIDALSGGNRQKVVLLRVMLRKPRVFLLNEPTRGVDLATKPEILKTIRHDLAARGGVVMTAESEEELVETCDRILVMYRGKVRRELRRAQPEFSAAEVYRTIQGVGL